MKLKKEIVYSVIEIIVVVVMTISIFKYAVIPVRIDGSSMENTLHDGSVALINGIGIDESDIKRFDIVVLYSDDLNKKIIKRVIGLPGETIEYKNDVLYVNGEKTTEAFLDRDFVSQSINQAQAASFTNDFTMVLGKGEYCVLGDNRLHSVDSRRLGVFTIKDIIGMKGLVVFPFDAIQWIE